MPSSYVSGFFKKEIQNMPGFDCCEQGCGILDFLYVKMTKALIVPQVAKRKGAETSSVQKLQRGA